jgi:hypothetical protein
MVPKNAALEKVTSPFVDATQNGVHPIHFSGLTTEAIHPILTGTSGTRSPFTLPKRPRAIIESPGHTCGIAQQPTVPAQNLIDITDLLVLREAL